MKNQFLLTLLLTVAAAATNLAAAPAEGDLIQTGNAIYVIRDGKRCKIPTMDVFAACGFDKTKIIKISADEVETIPEGPVCTTPVKPYKIAKEGDLIQGSEAGIFIIHDHIRFSMGSMKNFNDCGFDVKDVIKISDEDLNAITLASTPWKAGK